MTLGQNQEKFTQDLVKLLSYLIENGYTVRLGEVERTQAQQELYIKQGKSKTSNSMHLKRCAADLHIFKNNQWLQSKQELQTIGDYWESLDENNKWGGNFKNFIDTPHFERQC